MKLFGTLKTRVAVNDVLVRLDAIEALGQGTHQQLEHHVKRMCPHWLMPIVATSFLAGVGGLAWHFKVEDDGFRRDITALLQGDSRQGDDIDEIKQSIQRLIDDSGEVREALGELSAQQEIALKLIMQGNSENERGQ